MSRRAAEQPALIGEAPASITEGIWANRGVLILASPDGIFRFQTSNGSVTKIYQRGGSALAALTEDRFAFARPDGVYAGWSDGSGRQEVHLSNRSVTSQAYTPAVSGSPGYMLFGRDGFVQAQRFDAVKLQFEGAPAPLFEQPGSYASSRTGTLISRFRSKQCRLAWVDRSGKIIRRVTPVLQFFHMRLRLSPDGTRALVCLRDQWNGYPDMWIADLTKERVTRLSFDGALDGAWSPDGRNVLLALQNGPVRFIPADGSSSGTSWPELKGVANDWSVDGRHVLFHLTNGKGMNESGYPLDSADHNL